MSRRLPATWSRWQRANTRRLIKQGLEKSLASKFSRAEARARANAAQTYGIKAAASASLVVEFLSDGSMRGYLLDEPTPTRGAAPSHPGR